MNTLGLMGLLTVPEMLTELRDTERQAGTQLKIVDAHTHPCHHCHAGCLCGVGEVVDCSTFEIRSICFECMNKGLRL